MIRDWRALSPDDRCASALWLSSFHLLTSKVRSYNHVLATPAATARMGVASSADEAPKVASKTVLTAPSAIALSPSCASWIVVFAQAIERLRAAAAPRRGD